MTGPGEPGTGPAPKDKDKDAWQVVYLGQLSRDLVPYHPDPPEAPEDELTEAALSDPDGATRGETAPEVPTFWRALVVVAVAIIALTLVFWRGR
jgi:hypothetical protein